MRIFWLACVFLLLFTNLGKIDAADHELLMSNSTALCMPPFIEKGCHVSSRCKRGFRGKRGKKGIAGTNGIPGAQGAQGAQGIAMVGVQGATGPQNNTAGATGALGFTGPTGATGATGNTLLNFASAYNTDIQTLFGITSSIEFSIDQVNFVGITRPIPSNFGVFEIQNTGKYLILWDLDFLATSSTPATLIIELFDNTHSTVFAPGEVITINTMDDEMTLLSGHVVASISAGTEVFLQGEVTNGPNVDITNCTLSIIQIAD